MIKNFPISPRFFTSNLILLFSTGIGLSILNYLNPLHSPIGHDFLVNSVSFIVISLALVGILFNAKRDFDLKQYSTSLFTWLSLAILLCIQPLLNTIRYADALIFPVGSLIVVMLASLTATNLLATASAKRQFIHQISLWLYVTLLLTFIIQLMQATDHQISLKDGWPVTRISTIPDRLDGNFGQTNHTAYAYLFGICCVMYQLDTLKNHLRQRYYQLGLLLLLVIFAVGISLTKSRAVLLMLVAATLVYFFGQYRAGNFKNRLAWCVGIWSIFAISYVVGGIVVATVATDAANASGGIGRLAASGVDSQRLALNYKAFLIFKDYPITGIGWRNFTVGAIPHVDEIKRITFSDSSHMIFTQIASELGIIGLFCLVPATWLILRSLHTRHSPESAMALAFVVATCIYACFEYPLWYFRYLVVFAIFLALIDQKNRVFSAENPKLPKILGGFSLVFAMMAGYYLYQYWTHHYLFWYDHPNLVTKSKNGEKTIKTASIFGFLNYNDMDLASVLEINPDKLPQKLAVFDRVLVDESSPYNLVSYGQLLSFDGKYDRALQVFKTACRIEETKENCAIIGKGIGDSAKVYPQHFQANYEAYQAWLKAKNLP